MDVKFVKLNPNATIPTKAHTTDAGFDLVATSYSYDAVQDWHLYGTGIAVEIPKGYVGLLFVRSSNRKTNSYLCNHVGVIDSGYRGEIMLTFKDRDKYENFKPYNAGDRIAQLIIIPYPEINFIEVTELEDSDRGVNGHGSSGK